MMRARECLGERCKQRGSDGCDLNIEAIVDCFYIRGDSIKEEDWVMSEWDNLLEEKPIHARARGVKKTLEEERKLMP